MPGDKRPTCYCGQPALAANVDGQRHALPGSQTARLQQIARRRKHRPVGIGHALIIAT